MNQLWFAATQQQNNRNVEVASLSNVSVRTV